MINPCLSPGPPGLFILLDHDREDHLTGKRIYRGPRFFLSPTCKEDTFGGIVRISVAAELWPRSLDQISSASAFEILVFQMREFALSKGRRNQ
jgi:hypothetical protein